MKVQKIANLQSRLADYKQAQFKFFTQDAPMIIGAAGVVITGLLYLVDRFSPSGFQNWEWTAVVLAVCFSMPPLLGVKPKRPTEEDVLADQALRRRHGLDDTVEE